MNKHALPIIVTVIALFTGAFTLQACFLFDQKPVCDPGKPCGEDPVIWQPNGTAPDASADVDGKSD